MPGDNIERAIKKGTGELEGVSYEEIQYEGYGPGGAAILAQVLTDNKNRTVSEIRRLFAKHGEIWERPAAWPGCLTKGVSLRWKNHKSMKTG